MDLQHLIGLVESMFIIKSACGKTGDRSMENDRPCWGQGDPLRSIPDPYTGYPQDIPKGVPIDIHRKRERCGGPSHERCFGVGVIVR